MASVINFPSFAQQIEARVAKGESEHQAIFAVCHRSDIDDLLDFVAPIEGQTDTEAFLCALLAEVAAISPAAGDYIVASCVDHICGTT